MSDRVRLAREIAARSEPRFIDTNPKSKTLEERLALAREIAARTPPKFIEIPRERGGGKVYYTEEQLTVMRGGRRQRNIAGKQFVRVVASEWSLPQCDQPLVEIDNRGQRLVGCLTCNLWSAEGKDRWVRLSEEDLRALHELRHKGSR